ncbi:MAG: hypothetical protein ABSD46_05805 [Bacteroidota bacterium]
MMKYFVITIAFTLLFFSMCCKNEPTKPPDEIIKNPREYTWTIDTLSYPGSMQTNMQDIWASSPSDAYVVGHNDQNRGLMYHFDGAGWTDIKLSTIQGGQIQGPIDLFSIYGFGSNDVYAVGEKIYTNPAPPPNFLDSSLIIHFDGVQWREISIARGRYLSSVWGANSQDVWAGGNFGTLYHYINGTWGKISFDSLSFISSIYGLSSTDVYFVIVKEDVIQPHDSLTYQLWRYNGNTMSMIDSYMVTPTNLQRKFGYDLWQTEQKLYSSGYGVYVMEANQWRQFLVNEYPLHIGGSSRNNIFAVGDFGRIFHWNGTDWLRLTAIENPNVQYLSVWANNKEAIIVGNDGSRTYVFHGK